MSPVRAPDVVRGDVPGLLCRGMPLRWRDEDTRFVATGAVFFDADDGPWAIATPCEGLPLGTQDHPSNFDVDWSDRAALYLCLAWLADRGHLCTWMLPTTHGGRVEAWDGLTAWEVSAIVVARSVGRVGRGLGPVRDMLGPNVAWTASKTLRSGRRVDLGHGGYKRTSVATMTATHTSDRRWFYGGGNAVAQSGERDWIAHPSADPTAWEAYACGMATLAALADGCALLSPGGVALPDLGAEHE